MTTTAAATGSAEKWGPLWGARAADWEQVELRQAPVYEEALRRLDVSAGERVLDIGCGAGVYLRLAADRGAHVTGIDASEALVARARAHVPEGDIRVGDMQALPFGDDVFDAVGGLTSFFFAADMVAALREAGRVARPGAPVLIGVWGAPERNDIERMKVVAREFMPPPPPGSAPPHALAVPGALEAMAAEAGLTPEQAFDVSWPFHYPDGETMARELMSPAGLSLLVGPERDPEVRTRIVEALAPCRRDDGSYRLEAEMRMLIARA
jgi:SAM-dependent methyltransferase